MSYYLGIDSGGTNTRVLLTDEAGVVQGSGYAGSANPNHYTPEQISENLRSAICQAMSSLPGPINLTSVFMGSSGISTDADRANMRLIVRGLPEIGADTKVVVENDTVIGLTGGLTGRPGVVLVAGTGSICYGMNAGGKRYLCGGWGAIADDVGSAPWIGTRAIQAAVFAQDGRGGVTSLRDIVFDFLELAEPRQLIHRLHNQGLERADIGRLAPLVINACSAGDVTATEIVNDAVAGLADLVRVTSERLFGADGCEMILVGGLALSGAPFQPLLLERIHAVAPGIQPRDPELTPVQGAVLEAMRAGGAAWNREIIAQLKAGESKNIHV